MPTLDLALDHVEDADNSTVLYDRAGRGFCAGANMARDPGEEDGNEQPLGDPGAGLEKFIIRFCGGCELHCPIAQPTGRAVSA